MTITVLLVDDHKIVREGTHQLLAQYPDIQVIGEATDGCEAVKMASELQPDVIVMDVRLPNLNGIEATRMIHKQNQKIKILILSAYDEDSYIFPLFEAGACGYLLKTSSGEELVRAIHTVHAGETVLSPRIGAKFVSRVTSRPIYQKNNMAEGLTSREMEVLHAAATGQSNKAIAADLKLSVQTVQVHLRNIYSKLNVSSRSEAVAHAIRLGWISLGQNDER